MRSQPPRLQHTFRADIYGNPESQKDRKKQRLYLTEEPGALELIPHSTLPYFMVSARIGSFRSPRELSGSFTIKCCKKQCTESTKDECFGSIPAFFLTTVQWLRAAHHPLENDCPLLAPCAILSHHPSPQHCRQF